MIDPTEGEKGARIGEESSLLKTGVSSAITPRLTDSDGGGGGSGGRDESRVTSAATARSFRVYIAITRNKHFVWLFSAD